MLQGSTALTAVYAGLGWKVCELYGVVEKEVCTCRAGGDCTSPGKHPKGMAWQSKATDNVEIIDGWDESDDPHNIGVLLGKSSMIVDIETDDPESQKIFSAFGFDRITTPTYTSGRGPHRIFRWQEGLPPAVVVKPYGIECRIGNGEKAGQSVLPPSVHWTGARYSWLPGLSPEDVAVAELPQELVEMMHEYYRGGAREVVAEGTRNNTVYRKACSTFGKLERHDDEGAKLKAYSEIQRFNAGSCKPPLSARELTAVMDSAWKFIAGSRTQSNTKVEPWKSNLIEMGLRFEPANPGDGYEWMPGDWRLSIVDADPWYYELYIPFYNARIKLPPNEFQSPALTSHAIMRGTRKGMVSMDKKGWRLVWDGGYTVKTPTGTRPGVGLCFKLLQAAEERVGDTAEYRSNGVIHDFVTYLESAQQPHPQDKPDPRGKPRWRADGTLWFNWRVAWHDLLRIHRHLNEQDSEGLLRQLSEVQGRDIPLRGMSGKKLYTVLRRVDLEKLRNLGMTGRTGVD